MAEDSNNAAARDPVEKVLGEFDRRREMLEEHCIRTRRLIEDCLEDAKVRFQSVQARVKKKEKLQAKYLDPDKRYTRLDDITDQAGLRVITYYPDELDRIVEVIKREFTVIPEESVDKRQTEPETFGYRAVNLICTHSEKRKADVQFKKHAELVFEIQVISILQHAWAEMEHEWYDLKEAYPPEIKRRFAQLQALLELAESVFVSLRDQRINYRRSMDVRVEAAMDVPVDAVSLSSFIGQEALPRKIAENIAGVHGIPVREPTPEENRPVATLAVAAGLTTLQKLRDSLIEHQADVLEYFRRAKQALWPTPMGENMSTSVGISHLAMMLLAAEGADRLIDVMKAQGWGYSVEEVRVLSKIAREVLAKGQR